MKKLPIGIQSIKKILAHKDYIYVDKTSFIKQLIDDGAPHFFISRPRRFGKSLFLNTLEEVFKGNKKLFEGCDIAQTDYQWEKFPVIYLDFAQIAHDTPEELKVGLQALLMKIGKGYGITVEGPSLQFQLSVLVEGLAKKNRVVVLIDEYDQPIINNLKNPEIAEKNRDILKNFFTTLKSLDRDLKMTFITGISKFSQVSLFSGLNNLKDITMDPKYGVMMGYTEGELISSFKEHAQSIAKEEGVKIEEVFAQTKEWYNGYRFSRKALSVYNPFSTLSFMDRQITGAYWYSTGTPTFLINEVKKHSQALAPLSGTTATESKLMDISHFDQIDLVALMYQTGYLTIQGYNLTTKRYDLGFPNEEVKEAFLETLINHFAKITPTLSSKCQEMLENNDLFAFFNQIKIVLASFPYHLFIKATEATYQSILLAILKGMEFEAEAEKLSNIGRVDLVIHTPKRVYLLELKLDSKVDHALKQMYEKKYYEQWIQKGKEIALIGVNFSSKTRTIEKWKGQLLSPSGEKIKDL